MSKIFVKLLLSLMVGISAAFGFSPTGKGELQKVGASFHATVQTTVKNIGDFAANPSFNASIHASVGTSTQQKEKASLKVNGNLAAQINNSISLADHSLSGLSLNNSSSNKTNATAKANSSKISVEFKDKLTSAFHLPVLLGQ